MSKKILNDTDMINVSTKIKEILVDILNINIIDIRTISSLKDNLGMDSFTALEFLAAIEQKFNITIDRGRISNVRTLQNVIELVKKYLRKAKNE